MTAAGTRLWWLLRGRAWRFRHLHQCDRCWDRGRAGLRGMFNRNAPGAWGEADKQEFRSMCECPVRYRLPEDQHSQFCKLVCSYCPPCAAVIRGEQRELVRLRGL